MEKEKNVKSKIIITGASGFIGSSLSKKFLNSNTEVYAVSRRNMETNDGIKWFKGDISNLEFVEALIKEIEPDYIYHLASHVCGDRDYNNMLLTFNSNLVSTFNILLTIHKHPIKRLILAGSFEERNSREEDLLIPSSPYAASKLASLNYALLFHKLYNTPVCIASIYMVYGPGQKNLTKLVPYVTIKTLNKETPKLTSGNRNVDWIYVDDVVDALYKMRDIPNIDGHSIEIGSGRSILTKDLVKILMGIVNPEIKPKFGALNDRPMEQERTANVSETYRKIGWKAKTSLKTGLKNTIEYYAKFQKK